MITLEITGADTLADKLAALPDLVTSKVALALARVLPDLQAAAAANINTRSGALANSLTPDLEQDADGVTASLGSDLPYAAAVEYGYQGTVTVREYVARRSEAFGRPIRAGTEAVTIRAHAIRMNVPEQAYLRSALADTADSILDQLNDAVAEAIHS